MPPSNQSTVARTLRRGLLPLVVALAAVTLLPACASNPARDLTAVDRTMVVTGYCPCKKCCGWKRTWYGKAVTLSGKAKKVGVTASGAKARHGTIAADARYAFGTPMHVPGYGRGAVTDRGGAIQGNHIDVFFKNHKEALRWGRKTLTVRVWLPARQASARR